MTFKFHFYSNHFLNEFQKMSRCCNTIEPLKPGLNSSLLFFGPKRKTAFAINSPEIFFKNDDSIFSSNCNWLKPAFHISFQTSFCSEKKRKKKNFFCLFRSPSFVYDESHLVCSSPPFVLLFRFCFCSPSSFVIFYFCSSSKLEQQSSGKPQRQIEQRLGKYSNWKSCNLDFFFFRLESCKKSFNAYFLTAECEYFRDDLMPFLLLFLLIHLKIFPKQVLKRKRNKFDFNKLSYRKNVN